MNTDKLKELALAATPGNWIEDEPFNIFSEVLGEYVATTLVDPALSLVSLDVCEANGKFIAEASPATILALIAQRDELLAAFQKLDVALELAWKAGILPHDALSGEQVREYKAAIAKAVQP